MFDHTFLLAASQSTTRDSARSATRSIATRASLLLSPPSGESHRQNRNKVKAEIGMCHRSSEGTTARGRAANMQGREVASSLPGPQCAPGVFTYSSAPASFVRKGEGERVREMDGWMDGWMENGWMDGAWMDGWMDGWRMNGWMDGWMEYSLLTVMSESRTNRIPPKNIPPSELQDWPIGGDTSQ